MMSAQTFKEKKRAKRHAGARTSPRASTKHEALPDEIDILQSWSPGQCFNPKTLYYMTRAQYAGSFMALTPGNVTNGYGQYLPHFAGSIRIMNQKTGQKEDVATHKWGSGTNQLDQLRKGERLYFCPEIHRYFSEDMIKTMMPSEADLQDSRKNRSLSVFKKEMDEVQNTFIY
jgi:hypothetical protein